jgi:hypothetical protein
MRLGNWPEPDHVRELRQRLEQAEAALEEIRELAIYASRPSRQHLPTAGLVSVRLILSAMEAAS